jgi:cytochrome P450
VAAFVAYLRDLIARKRAAPDGALLSALIAARDDDDRLSEDELTSTVFLLLVAGHETTVHLIGSGIYLLLTDPARADRLRAEPQDISAAVEEFLRYESPVAMPAPRVATEPVEIGDTVIATGEVVVVTLLSANRDAAAFADPDHFRPARGGDPHLAFGHGAHFCLGAPLARLEGRLAIEALLRRYPGMRLAVGPDEMRWGPGIFVHGLAELPVILGPPGP